MKTKKQLSIVILVTGLLVTGIVYGEDPVKGSGTPSTSGTSQGLGWQEQTRRVTVLYNDGIRINTGPSVGTSGLGWTLSFSSNFTQIECCQRATLKQSWCNFDADDERCPN